MMQQTLRVLFLAILACSVSGVALADPPTVKNRQQNQQQRIRQGARSGELTAGETVRLQKGAARTRASIAKDRNDQGVFTPRERAKAQRKLNRQSKRVAVQKHDGDKRPRAR